MQGRAPSPRRGIRFHVFPALISPILFTARSYYIVYAHDGPDCAADDEGYLPGPQFYSDDDEPCPLRKYEMDHVFYLYLCQLSFPGRHCSVWHADLDGVEDVFKP